MKNNIIGLKELRENTEKYIRQIDLGHSFVVVKKSKPVFKISPIDEWGDEGIWESYGDLSKVQKGGVPAEEMLRHMSNELNTFFNKKK
ncbi:MAG: type II toxin-antitoxin system prevent-host-death family antitoxin [bacterium]